MLTPNQSSAEIVTPKGSPLALREGLRRTSLKSPDVIEHDGMQGCLVWAIPRTEQKALRQLVELDRNGHWLQRLKVRSEGQPERSVQPETPHRRSR